MKHKDQVYETDRKYRQVLKKTCKYVLSFHHGLPIEWLDIYNAFLFEVDGILKEYKQEKDVSLNTYLQIKCKYFAFNFCKHYTTNKFKTMNTSLRDVGFSKMASSNGVSLLNPIDTTIFTPLEYIVYSQHYLNGSTLKEVSDTNNISFYKVRQLISNIKVKLIMQLKN